MLKNKAIQISVLTVIAPLMIQLFYVRYISYNVDKEIYGNFIILSSIIYGISQVFLSIPGQAFSRFYNGAEDKLEFINEFRTYLIGVNILSSIMIYFIYLIYGDRFDFYIYFSVYILFALFNNYIFNQKIFLLSLERNKYFILKLLESIAKFILPLIFYMINQTLLSFILGVIVGYGASIVVLLLMLRDKPFEFALNIENQKKYFLYAYPILISAVFSWSMAFSDRYFIDYYLTTKDVAIYSILAQFSGVAQVLGAIFSTYVNPIILKKYEINKDDAIEALNKYLKLFALMLFFVFVFVLLIPRGILSLFMERDIIFSDYYYYTFLILVLSVVFTVFQTAVSLYFVLFKKLDIYAKIFAFSALVNFGLNFFIHEYGIIFAAISTFIGYLIITILIIFKILQHKRISY